MMLLDIQWLRDLVSYLELVEDLEPESGAAGDSAHAP